MKSKDVLLIGGIGLLAYIALSQPKKEETGGSATSFIPIPSTSTQMDLGGLFQGIAGLLGTVVTPNIVPEINIPEFKFPDINIPEYPTPDWSKLLPDWDKFLPDWERLIPPIPEELNVGGGGGGDKTETSIPTIFGQVGSGVSGLWRDTIIGIVPSPLRDLMIRPKSNWYDTWSEIRTESEAIFEEAGITEVTPDNVAKFLKAKEKVTGIAIDDLPPIGTSAYLATMLGSR